MAVYRLTVGCHVQGSGPAKKEYYAASVQKIGPDGLTVKGRDLVESDKKLDELYPDRFVKVSDGPAKVEKSDPKK